MLASLLKDCTNTPAISSRWFLWTLLFTLAGVSNESVGQTQNSFIRVSVFGPAVPHQETQYALEDASGVYTFRVERKGFGQQKRRQEVTLVTSSAWEALTKDLQAYRGLNQRAKWSKSNVNYLIEFRLKTRTGRWLFSEADLRQDEILWPWISRLRNLESQRFKPMVYWDGDVPKKQSGLLWLSSKPKAFVSIDSIPLNAQTPVLHLRLLEGRHTVLLTRPDDGSLWSYEVLIKAGATTRLEVELR
tara:strand:+ start:583 stop:1320 length:738 start_codon:yes stop_codon:yes gene_type:complete